MCNMATNISTEDQNSLFIPLCLCRVNIVGGEMTSGHEVVPYLQPVPPRGTGLHRHVFSLYTHPSPIHVDTTRMNSGGTW